MNPELEALIIQNKKQNDETNASLDIIIEQNEKNKIQPELEAIAKANIDTKETIESGNKDIFESLKEIKEVINAKELPKFPKFPEIKIPEPLKSIEISNLDNSDIINGLNEIKNLISDYFKKDNSLEEGEKEEKHKELVDSIKGIIFPKGFDYSEYLKKIVNEIKRDKVYFPKELIEENRVKVTLSDEQIKELGKEMSVTVTPNFHGGGGYERVYIKNKAGAEINPASEEKQDEIKTAIENIDTSTLATEETAQSIAGFNIPAYDYKEFGYTGTNITTITYKTGGSGGTTVATLTLAYDGSNNITSITKS